MGELLNIILLVIQGIGLGAMVVLLIWAIIQDKEIAKVDKEKKKKEEQIIMNKIEEIIKENEDWWRQL